jgi:hypothetical protein
MRKKYLGLALGMGLVLHGWTAQAQQIDPLGINSYGSTVEPGLFAQTRTVSELTDVQPNDWAFGALKSLVERYGCIEGYPTKIFRGKQALNRYEFAAGLNRCLEKIAELTTAQANDLATREDLARVTRLQEQFKTELAQIKGNVTGLEARSATLTQNQFAPLAKMDGSVVMAIQGGGAASNVYLPQTVGVAPPPYLGVPGQPLSSSTPPFNAFSLASGSQPKITDPKVPFIIPGLDIFAGPRIRAQGEGYSPAVGDAIAVNIAEHLNASYGSNIKKEDLLDAVPGNAAGFTSFGRATVNLRFAFAEDSELLIRMRGTTGSDISGTFPGIAGNSGTAFYGGTSFPAFNGTSGAFDGSPLKSFAGNIETSNGLSQVYFDKIRFSFKLSTPVGPVRLYIGPRLETQETIDTNSFAGNAEVDFSNGSIMRNPLTTFIQAGSGLALDWDAGRDVNLHVIYIGGDAGRSGGKGPGTLAFGYGDGGLVGAENFFGGELEWRLGTAKLKFQVLNFGEQTGNFFAGATVVGNYLFGNIIGSGTAAYGINGEWAITPNFGIFGRYGVSASSIFGITPATAQYPAAISTSYFSAGFSWSDLGAPGNVLGVAVGQPTRISGGYVDTDVVKDLTGKPIVDGIGTFSLIPRGTEYDIEAFYSIRVSDNLTITPDLQIILEPNHIQGNPTLTVGTVRAVYNF